MIVSLCILYRFFIFDDCVVTPVVIFILFVFVKYHDCTFTYINIHVEFITDFFAYVNTNVYLTVRKDNIIANKFYDKVGMKQVGTISWAKGTMPGLIWKKEIPSGTLEEFV